MWLSSVFSLFLGECIGRFTNRKIPYCVKFNPDEDKQHLFVCGTSDKKILTVSCFIVCVLMKRWWWWLIRWWWWRWWWWQQLMLMMRRVRHVKIMVVIPRLAEVSLYFYLWRDKKKRNLCQVVFTIFISICVCPKVWTGKYEIQCI